MDRADRIRRELSKHPEDTIGYCKPISFLDKKIVIVYCESGKILNILLDGEEIEVNEDNITTIAKMANSEFDCYSGYTATEILLFADHEELGCCGCPYFDDCTELEDAAIESVGKCHLLSFLNGDLLVACCNTTTDFSEIIGIQLYGNNLEVTSDNISAMAELANSNFDRYSGGTMTDILLDADYEDHYCSRECPWYKNCKG